MTTLQYSELKLNGITAAGYNLIAVTNKMRWINLCFFSGHMTLSTLVKESFEDSWKVLHALWLETSPLISSSNVCSDKKLLCGIASSCVSLYALWSLDYFFFCHNSHTRHMHLLWLSLKKKIIINSCSQLKSLIAIVKFVLFVCNHDQISFSKSICRCSLRKTAIGI